MSKIKLLPKAVANQIAAGEVIQRPASIVKELIENSIDANAKNIKLIVKDAGKESITVIDDGNGMNEEDIKKIKALLHSHRKYTDSHLASFILDDIQNQKNNFTKVYPKELRRIHEKNKIHANG